MCSWCARPSGGGFGGARGEGGLGEALEEALRREFREEVGLALSQVRFALVQEAIFSPEFYKPTHMLLFNYFARAEGRCARTRRSWSGPGWSPRRGSPTL